MHWLMQAARRRVPVLPGVIEAWLKRDVVDAETFAELTDELKAKAFTVSGQAWAALLEDLYLAIYRAIATGMTASDWAREVWPKIAEQYGEYGAAVAARLDLIFRTNVQAAYAAGRYSAMFARDMLVLYPYWRYRAILDTRVRPEHRALHGSVFRKDDPAARGYLPPLGFNCRCVAEELDDEDVRAGGWTVREGSALYADPAIGPPPPGWDTDRVSALVPAALRFIPSR